MRSRYLSLLLAVALAAPASAEINDPEARKGVALVEAGDYDQGIFILDAAARRLAAAGAPPAELADVYVHLGIAYLGKGHEAAARARFREAVTQIRTLNLSPDQYPPKVINAFEAAREEALRAAPAPAGASAPSAPATAPTMEKKGGKGKIVLLGVGGLALAGGAVALAGGGGDGGSGTGSGQTQSFTRTVNDGEEAHFTLVAAAAGTLEATVTWTDGQKDLGINCQQSEPPYTACTPPSNRTNNTTRVLRATVTQQTYLLAVTNYSGRGAEAFQLTVRLP